MSHRTRQQLGGRQLTQREEDQIHSPSNIIDSYNEVLTGTRKQVPFGSWDDQENGRILTKYLLEDILKLNLEEIPEKITAKMFHHNKLSGMLGKIYNDSPAAAVIDTYGSLPWQGEDVELKIYYFKNITTIMCFNQ